MAIKHHLALEIVDTACDHVLPIIDISTYASMLPVECSRLDITLPGFYQPVYLDVEPHFNEAITAVRLGMQNEDNNGLATLPDGIYTIRYSVAPNDYVFVEYKFLRTTLITNEYYREVCKIQLAECEPSREVIQKMKDLRYIKMLIDAAKAKANYCDACVSSIDMLQYAQRLLKEYQLGKCLTCNL